MSRIMSLRFPNIIYLMKRKIIQFKQGDVHWFYCSRPNILWRWKNLKQLNQLKEMDAEIVDLIGFPQGLQQMKQALDQRAEKKIVMIDLCGSLRNGTAARQKSKVEFHYSLSVVTIKVMLKRRNNDKHLASKTVLLFFKEIFHNYMSF